MVSSEETAPTTAAPAVIERYFNGVNTEDWADFKGIWHDDAVVEVVGGIRVQGWDAIQPYYVGALQNFPVHYDDPYRVHVAGDTITVEIAFTGETVDGVPTTFEAVDVFTIEDGLVRRLTTWYDLDRVLRFTRTPGTPERRLRTLVRHAAAASPFYRSRFEELGLDPDAVAADLTLLPVTGLDGVAADELVAVPPRAITHVCARDAEAVPLSRADLAERGRIWSEALALAGVGRGDTVIGLEPSPGLADGVAQAKAQLAFATDPALAGGHRCRPRGRSAGGRPAQVRARADGSRASCDRPRRIVLQRRHDARAHRRPRRRDRRRQARHHAARRPRPAAPALGERHRGELARRAVHMRERAPGARSTGNCHRVSVVE